MKLPFKWAKIKGMKIQWNMTKALSKDFTF